MKTPKGKKSKLRRTMPHTPDPPSPENIVRVHHFDTVPKRKNHVPIRVLEAAYPNPRTIMETYNRYHDILSPRSRNFLTTTLENTNSTRYARLAKRYTERSFNPETSYWTHEAWEQHKGRLKELAAPKEIREAPYVERKKTNLQSLIPRLTQLSSVPNCRLVAEDRDKPFKISKEALKYRITHRVNELAKPRKSFEEAHAVA